MRIQQYTPVQLPGGEVALLLALGQTLHTSRGAYTVESYVNYDEQTGAISSGQAFVYRGKSLGSRQEVAIKQLLLPHHPAARERHQRECNFLCSTHSHALVACGLDTYRDGEQEFLILEWVSGQTIGQEIAQRMQQGAGPIATDVIVARGVALAGFLNWINTRGFLFRDFNENNVMTVPGSGGAVGLKVIDFGGILPIHSQRPTHLLPPSAAPELLQNPQRLHYTTQTEVFALGSLLYYMATGNFVDASAGPITPPIRFNPAITPELSQLIMHALSPKPADRPATPGLVAQKLLALQNGPPSSLPTQRIGNALVVVQSVHPMPLPVIAVPVQNQYSVSTAVPVWRHLSHRMGARYRSFQAQRRVQARLIYPVLLGFLCFPLVSSLLSHRDATPENRQAIPVPHESKPSSVLEPVRTRVAEAKQEPTPRTLQIEGLSVRLRTQPSLQAEVKTTLSYPAEVQILGVKNGWCYVKDASGVEGYIYGAYLPDETRHHGVLIRSLSEACPAGSKVLVTGVDGGEVALMLPDGQNRRIPADWIDMGGDN